MKLIENESLDKYTSYKIGGTTNQFYIAESVEDLLNLDSKILQEAYILGAGTNLLISDDGIDKPVIKINLINYQIAGTNLLTVESGLLLNQIGKITAENGLRGLVHVSGIPGSIGGAIVMNAGASHGTISDYLINVEALNKQTKERKIFKKEECGFGHRKSIFQNNEWIILNASFRTEPGSKEKLIEIYKSIQEARKRNYPLTFPSAGCWFKKSWGGKEIIKKIGMDGKWCGRAVVSPMFPAFILNTGKATTRDIYTLVRKIQEGAKEIGEDMPLEIVTWGKIKSND